jgi:hypothetical protein
MVYNKVPNSISFDILIIHIINHRIYIWSKNLQQRLLFIITIINEKVG